MSQRHHHPSLFRSLATGARRLAAAGTVALLGIVVAAPAFAAPATLTPNLVPRLTGAVTWTAASGDTNYYSKVLEPASQAASYAAFWFEWSERSDAPCWAQVMFRELGPGTGSQHAKTDRCTKHTASKKGVGRGQPNEVITGVQVCLNEKASSGKSRIKGVRLWGRTIDPETGALGPINGPSFAERKHCKQWAKRVDCPGGQVAAKLKLFGSSSFTGISLGCRAVHMGANLQPVTLP